MFRGWVVIVLNPALDPIPIIRNSIVPDSARFYETIIRRSPNDFLTRCIRIHYRCRIDCQHRRIMEGRILCARKLVSGCLFLWNKRIFAFSCFWKQNSPCLNLGVFLGDVVRLVCSAGCIESRGVSSMPPFYHVSHRYI